MSRMFRTVRRWLIDGIALTIPLVATVVILLFVLQFVLGLLAPIVAGVALLWPTTPPTPIVQAGTVVALLCFFLLVGIVADLTPGEKLSAALQRLIERIPVVSTIYLTFRRASDLLVDDDGDQFREVLLVEFPHEGAYTFGFLTAETPRGIESAVGATDLRTVMVPLGPNPTTNGFVMHLSDERVHEVDVTVEEAMRSIATLGVATEELPVGSDDG